MKKIIHITKCELREAVQTVLRQEIPSIMALNTPISQQKSLNEIARINVKDKGNIFPYNAYEICVYSNDLNPPHIHVISKQEGYMVRISIASGDLVSVESYGSRERNSSFSDVVKQVKAWFKQASNVPGFSGKTNQEVALGMWSTMNEVNRIKLKSKYMDIFQHLTITCCTVHAYFRYRIYA